MNGNVNGIIEIVVSAAILLGTFLHLLGTFGLIRLPDIYNRTHAMTKASTLGVIFVLSGAALYFGVGEGQVNTKIVLGIVFVFLTSPVAGHLITRAAYRTREPLWEKSVQDDLKPVLARRICGKTMNVEAGKRRQAMRSLS